jgi:RNA polymerase sigma factor (sigma-70 family)
MSQYAPSNPGDRMSSRFSTTHWSVILAAGASGPGDPREAMERLCKTYWFPLYTYLRRRGCDTHRAEDCTQAFFAALLQRHGLDRADPQQGKFRSFLLSSLNHFLADERDRAGAQKRGGGREIVSLDVGDAETRYRLDPAHDLTPEKLFEKSWSLTVLSNAMSRLKAEFTEAGKSQLFETLKPHLPAGKGPTSYKDVAARLGMTESAVKVAVYRLRQRYRQFVREEVAQTVATPEQVDEEIRDLFAALAE